MNVFDELNGYYDGGDAELHGLFKKLKKAVKSGVKSVRKVTSKIAKKTLPSEIRRIGRDIDKSGITKIAAGAALMMVGIPAIGGLGGIGAKAAGIAAKGLTTVKSAVGGLKLASVVKGASGAMSVASAAQKYKAQKVAQQAAAETQAATKQAIDFSEAVGASPEFAQALHRLRAEGYSDEQILQHWKESKSYYLAAVTQTADVVRPQIFSQAVSAGMPINYATQFADEEALNIAKTEVSKVQSAANLPLMVGLAAAAYFLMGK